MRDLRKEARHRAADGSKAWLDSHWEDVAMCIENLFGRLNAESRSMETAVTRSRVGAVGPEAELSVSPGPEMIPGACSRSFIGGVSVEPRASSVAPAVSK